MWQIRRYITLGQKGVVRKFESAREITHNSGGNWQLQRFSSRDFFYQNWIIWRIIARAKYLFFNKISDLNKNIRLRAGRRRRHEKLETLVFYLFDHPNNFFITTTRNN